MEAKYYTPELKEFHVGFEYEIKDLHDDLKTECWRTDSYNSDFPKYLEDWLKKGDIRVKYLDREDVESFGWIFSGNEVKENPKHVYVFKGYLNRKTPFEKAYNELYVLTHTPHDNIVTITDSSVKNQEQIHRPTKEQIFKGTIKNKSKLRDVMEMLGIKS